MKLINIFVEPDFNLLNQFKGETDKSMSNLTNEIIY